MKSFHETEPAKNKIKPDGSHASKSTPQFGFNKGLQMFGDNGWEATKKELDKNLLGMEAVTMLKKSEWKQEEYFNALRYLMFLKRKRFGKIKARGVADGHPQKEYISKEESSSPTVSIYALICHCAISAIEGRKVVTADILAAYLQSEWPKDKYPTYLRFKGEMVKMICKINPKYEEYVATKKYSKRILIGEMNRAVYGNVMSGLLFYQKLATFLEGEGFEPNPYDACTWNKQLEGLQMTIQFFVDDLCCSHKSQIELDKMMHIINQKFKMEKQELTVTNGNVHDYLGITINFSYPKLVRFTMYDFLEDILSEVDAQGNMSGYAVTPAADKLFEIDENSEDLSVEDADFFHRIVAHFLFAAKQTRPDIQLAVAFLCTRVKKPN